MRYFKYLLALAALTLPSLALAQSVGTYTESANSNTVKNAVGVTLVQGTVAVATTATPADATANTNLNLNLLRQQGYQMVFNGTTWDRQPGSTAGTSVIPGMPLTWWRYAPPVGGLVNSTAGITIKAAAGAGVSNYVWGGECYSDALATATELEIRDGASGTVMWRIKVPTSGWTNGFDINFNPPLRGTANTLVEFAGTTASATGAIYCNWRGSTGN